MVKFDWAIDILKYTGVLSQAGEDRKQSLIAVLELAGKVDKKQLERVRRMLMVEYGAYLNAEERSVMALINALIEAIPEE